MTPPDSPTTDRDPRNQAARPTRAPGSSAAARVARIGLVSISDRASAGVYQDLGLPGLKAWLDSAISSPWQAVERLIPDDQTTISATLIELVDQAECDLVFTTGGTGPAARDVTPEATLAVADKELPGFGEQMRQISLHYVPTAILSRQVGVIRGKAMIVNLPGQPKSIAETLGGVRSESGQMSVPGIFAAIPYGLELIGGPSIDTHDTVCKAFRPKKK
jgi:molybdopterin adenylyltransferase